MPRPPFVGKVNVPLYTDEKHCFNAILSHVIASPVELLRRTLDGLLHLGPLRQIPARGFIPNRSIDSAMYSTGLAAWDSLAFASEEFFENVNKWMSDAKKLATGFRIVREQTKVMPAGLETPSDIAKEYFKAVPRTRVILADANSGLEVEPSEIGVGVSQLLPAVVFALSDAAKILLIEQPELHLHPRAQCEVGDLLIQGALGKSPKTIIVKTHSEHLILRILRRIRETGRGVQSERPAITPLDVAIWYVERVGGASNPIRIGVDEHGEFTTDWPDDFFESDFYERFA